jgi:hypothetical protein
MFTSIIETGDSRMPARAATPALIAQISAEDKAADVYRPVRKGGIERNRIIPPRDPGAGTEDEAEAQGQHDDGELRLPDDPPYDECIKQVAKRGRDDDRQQGAQPVRQAEQRDHAEGGKATQHHDVALGEIHQFGSLVDQHEAKRDKSVDTTRSCTVHAELQETRSFFHCWQLPPLIAQGALMVVAPLWL